MAGPPPKEGVTISVGLLRKMLQLSFQDVFSEEWYLKTYPDVKKAVSDGVVTSALSHYVESGIYEGRFPFDMKLDVDDYLSEHEDVDEAVKDGVFPTAAHHFRSLGYAEGRRFQLETTEAAVGKAKIASK